MNLSREKPTYKQLNLNKLGPARCGKVLWNKPIIQVNSINGVIWNFRARALKLGDARDLLSQFTRPAQFGPQSRIVVAAKQADEFKIFGRACDAEYFTGLEGMVA